MTEDRIQMAASITQTRNRYPAISNRTPRNPLSMKYFFATLLLAAIALPLAAQPLAGSSKEEQLLIVADSSRSIGNWVGALENYEIAYDQNDDLPLRPTIALMHLKLRDIAAANRNYKSVFRRMEATDTTNNVHRFYYGQSLKMDGQYEEAQTYFEQFLALNTDEKMGKMARLELEGIKLYRDAPTETGEVALENLGRKVNGQFSEYRPILSNDESTLYFSTWKATDIITQGDANDDEAYSRIFMTSREVDDEGVVKYGKVNALDKEVNRPGLHTANPALSPDGRRLYYNRIRMESNVIAECKIYFSDQEDDGWKSGNAVSGINGDHLALHPTPGELFGQEVMFFVSDMDGGSGGRDIYYANYEGEGKYGPAINLGPGVNTAGDDDTPFYFDGTLYFSSNGYPTMGGFDLFYAAWNGSEWSTPENMGTGFNSTVDDQGLSVFGDGLLGYMTSNREGGRSVKSKTCCDDIYSFQIASLYANLVVGLFDEGKQPLNAGTIELQPLQNGNPAGPGSQKSRDDGNRFDFGLELETVYQIVASHPGYYPDTIEMSTLALEESKEFQQVFFLKQIPPPPPPDVTIVREKQPIVLENILYDFGDDKILPDAEPDLIYLASLMDKYPDMVIELGSHTDTRGTSSANQNLSQRRASSARRYLITKGGITAARIKTEGYGETVPQTATARLASRIEFLNEGDVITDAFIAALPDEETRERAHRLNRRTEFRILEGPTEIEVDMNQIENKTEMPDRGSEPRETDRRSQKVDGRSQKAGGSVRVTGNRQPAPITRFSSLFGQSDIAGLPILQFTKRELDLGAVRHGEARTFDYTFTNTGKVPAQIMLIQACDCTTVEHNNSKVYQPGESGMLKVTFDSTSKEEDETITIDIFLEQNDKNDTPILEMVEYRYTLTK